MSRLVRILMLVALVGAACRGADQEPAVAPLEALEAVATTMPGLEPAPTPAPASASSGTAPTPPPPDPSNDAAAAPAETTPPDATGGPAAVERLTVEVLETMPHDPAAYTQGLLVEGDIFLESTGLRSESDLRRVDVETGAILQIVPAPEDFFAEGIARVDDELIQLTWRDGTALFWDATSFELKRQVPYSGEGWGLCYDGDRLVMSDGTPTLTFRDPVSFDEIGEVQVTLNGDEVPSLNELECVGERVWANVYQTDFIVRIDPATGIIDALVDASSLEQPRVPELDVLNGIAYDAATDSFYVTGKLWPTMYRVRFVPASATEGS